MNTRSCCLLWWLAPSLGLILTPARAITLTNYPSADTYSEVYGNENKNLGSEPVLRIDQWGGRQMFLRFNLDNVPPDKRLVAAKVRLYVVDIGFAETGQFPELKTCVALFDVVTPWTEAGLTHNSPDGVRTWSQGPGIAGARYTDVGPLPKPDIGVMLHEKAIPLQPAVVTNKSWLELDVTAYVRELLRTGKREANLLLRSSTLGRNYTFRSREAAQIEERPQLVVQVDEQLPAFHIESPFTAGWKSGQSIAVVGPHPRLYVTAESLAKIRAGAKSGARLTKAFLQWVTAGSTHANQGRFHDSGLNEGCENNSLAWLITGDRQYLSNSIAYARRILQKPMREHFEDVHAATFLGAAWVHAMALHYDWCYEQLPQGHRKAVVEWLKEAAAWSWVRSGAPIAHNDGGARQCLLASAALALLSDDPEAPELYRRSTENFSKNLLPWLNDGGRGGRSGDGGEYEGLHAFYIVRYAWMSWTATGEDVFSESPFFFNRLKHILFGWYPRPLVDRNEGFSMRQYYSPSGDHIRLGYVGDTQPYQSAAALCARYPETPEAQAVRWLAGEWPTQWMQYTLRWAVLGNFENVPAHKPTELCFLDPGCNTVFMRSDWSDDATWVLFENAPYVSVHGSLDSGTFEIFKGDLLAARTGNLDHGNVGATHTMNYLHRTIAGNCLLIEDPAEKWKGFLGGAEGGQDGGGQRTNFPLGASPDAETYTEYRDLFQRGQITAFRSDPKWVYTAADLTPAYNNVRIHGGKLNRPKVDSVTRELLYLRPLDSLIVFDRVTSVRPEFKKAWLLHSLGELEVLDGKETKVDDGEYRYSGASKAVIRYGWPKPVPSFSRCLSVTLLPENATTTKIGGRSDLPQGQTDGFPGDQWHGKHQHSHIKDFWVNGTNYPPGNPPETRWFGEPGASGHVQGTPDESGGRGKWRIEVRPSLPSKEDVFLHALCPRLGKEGSFPDVKRISGPEGFAAGTLAENGQCVFFFFRNSPPKVSTFSTLLPENAKGTCFLTGLSAGAYTVQIGNRRIPNLQVTEDGLLVIDEAEGKIVVVAL